MRSIHSRGRWVRREFEYAKTPAGAVERIAAELGATVAATLMPS